MLKHCKQTCVIKLEALEEGEILRIGFEFIDTILHDLLEELLFAFAENCLLIEFTFVAVITALAKFVHDVTVKGRSIDLSHFESWCLEIIFVGIFDVDGSSTNSSSVEGVDFFVIGEEEVGENCIIFEWINSFFLYCFFFLKEVWRLFLIGYN